MEKTRRNRARITPGLEDLVVPANRRILGSELESEVSVY